MFLAGGFVVSTPTQHMSNFVFVFSKTTYHRLIFQMFLFSLIVKGTPHNVDTVFSLLTFNYPSCGCGAACVPEPSGSVGDLLMDSRYRGTSGTQC